MRPNYPEKGVATGLGGLAGEDFQHGLDSDMQQPSKLLLRQKRKEIANHLLSGRRGEVKGPRFALSWMIVALTRFCHTILTFAKLSQICEKILRNEKSL